MLIPTLYDQCGIGCNKEAVTDSFIESDDPAPVCWWCGESRKDCCCDIDVTGGKEEDNGTISAGRLADGQ